MSDDNRPVLFVPVDPKVYGLGMGLGCLIRFWKQLLVAAILMAVIFNIMMWVSDARNKAEQARWVQQSVETETSLGATAVVNTNLAVQGLARLSEWVQQRQSVQVNYRGAFDTIGTFEIKYLDFTQDGMRVYFDYQAREYLRPEQASLVWEGTNCPSCRLNWYIISPSLVSNVKNAEPIEDHYVRQGPVTTSATNDEWYHYWGYWLFSYDVLPGDASQIGPDTLTYFINFGEDPSYYNLVQIPVLDLANPQNWVAAAHLEEVPSGAMAREQGEGANSSMVLEGIEHEPGDAGVMLNFGLLLDQNAGGYRLDAAQEVYLEAAGQRFPATAWGGSFQGKGSIEALDGRNMIEGAANPLGLIYFADAWNAIQQSGCFNIIYGAYYSFEGVCLNGQGGVQVLPPTQSSIPNASKVV